MSGKGGEESWAGASPCGEGTGRDQKTEAGRRGPRTQHTIPRPPAGAAPSAARRSLSLQGSGSENGEAEAVTSRRQVRSPERRQVGRGRLERALVPASRALRTDPVSPGVPHRAGQSLCLKPRVSHEVF